MKRIIPFFAVCLGLSAFGTATVVGAETARTPSKRDVREIVATTNTSGRSDVGSTRQKSDKNRDEITRNVATSRTTQIRNVSNARPTVKTRTATTDATKTTVSRTRTATPTTNLSRSTATQKSTTSRTAISGKTASRTAARATTLNDDKIATIKTQDYSKCRTVYYDCMDEFCANKDANLRRCACSSRIHEFDAIQQQLGAAEEKMLDFNQRLLAVGLDKEDAAAINVATEGEIGYSTQDKTASEKTLKKITDALNSSGNSKINNDLSAISLSLNVDSAWDSIDSTAGIATTSKNGIDLYNAARPVCVAMAKEVCSDHELEIIQNSYQLSIQQDCNTVAKSYDTKYNQAMEKIHESSALLDMSRLNAYQQRNSDDILTCKKKILDKMSESSVCGEKLQKCLDVTGQYIDPSTGGAVLSNNLYNITNLLTSPVGTEKWSEITQNQQFVSFLNSKKTFLESATQQCQDIADIVWKDFLDDALAQIKLAQTAKIEEIRQSCTTLVAECKSNTNQNLTDFDVRALSTFAVLADSTTNALCSDIENSCTALLNSSGGGGELWDAGMTEIAAASSYEAIIQNCTTVGRDCIIQHCNGAAGNFALCGDFTSAPRRAILTRNACWNEVLACVNQSSNLSDITPETLNSDFYSNMYGIRPSNTNVSTIYTNYNDFQRYLKSKVYTLCENDSDTACKITEQIWGNCNSDPENTMITTNPQLFRTNEGFSDVPSLLLNLGDTQLQIQNKIFMPKSEENTSLLSWLAINTGTSDALDSCSAYECPVNYKFDETLNKCIRVAGSSAVTTDGTPYAFTDQIIHVDTNITNFCPGGLSSKDLYGNCCVQETTDNGDTTLNGAVSSNGICVPASNYSAVLVQSVLCDPNISSEDTSMAYYCAPTIFNTETGTYKPKESKQIYIYCVTLTENVDSININPNGELECYGGHIIFVDEYGNYIKPKNRTSEENIYGPTMMYYYRTPTYNSLLLCTNTYRDRWDWVPDSACKDYHTDGASIPKDNEFIIQYGD